MNHQIAGEPRPGADNPGPNRLPFDDVPGQSRLFLQYQSDPLSLREFYPNAVEKFDDLASNVDVVLSEYQTDRAKLCASLAEMNSSFGSGTAVASNIDLLRDPQTVAVVTGQQAGLFTGPLYTIYKALTAIRGAERMRAAGVKAVPVFWAATEDHDFAEVAETWMGANQNVRVEYQSATHLEGTPVGNVHIDAGIDRAINVLIGALPKTEFSYEFQAVLKSHWSAGTFGTAFCRTLADLLGKYGLIIIDPLHQGTKVLSAPIYKAAIDRSDEIVAGLINHNGRLKDAAFHSQVLIDDDHFPLFWIDNEGRRTALRKVGPDTFRPKSGKQIFSRTELAQLADSQPQRLSPGVVLRPVVQDYLLPTICYFGGAAEVAYFAQNSAVYRALSRPVTPILHRQSFTIVEPRIRRALAALGLGLRDLFRGQEAVTMDLAAENDRSGLGKLFAQVEEEINTELNRLDQQLDKLDTTLAESLARRRKRIIYHIGTLQRKALISSIQKDATMARRIDDVWTQLMPNGALQERSINVFSYLNEYGLSFIDQLYKATDVDERQHRIIDIR